MEGESGEQVEDELESVTSSAMKSELLKIRRKGMLFCFIQLPIRLKRLG